MRKRIQRLAKGQFEYVKPIVEFSEEKIEIRVTEDADYPESFELLCKNDQKLRGIVYSTNDRMECLTPQFEGEKVKIRYCFHGKGLSEGDVCEGKFLIVCAGAQYNLPFHAIITKNYPESSIGRICNLQEFASLAREHWEEARQLFYHKSFAHLFRQNEEQERLLYRAFTGGRPSNQNLEEFLIGIHKKDPIILRIDEQNFKFADITEAVQEVLHLHKDGWGYLSVQVSVDAPFVHLEKENLSGEDFLGSGCNLCFQIVPNKLHAGKNYARITCSTVYQTLQIEIEVRQFSCTSPSSAHARIREYKAALVELYQAWRLKRMVTGAWVNETVDILTDLYELLPDQPIYLLMKANAYIIGKQRQEADWILRDFKHFWHDRRDPLWGYYLYLQTLLEREPVYVDQLTHEIENIFRENPDSVLLFLALSFLEEQYYNNSQEKLRAINRWIEGGTTSPILYVEAYYLLAQEPYLLRSFGVAERRVLYWARKMHCLTQDLTEQIFTIAESSRNYDPLIYRILCEAYDVNQKPEHVGVICSYLMKGHKYDVEYHLWYERGVESELKITGLYEAYLLSLDEREVKRMPRIIQMYFQYRSNLPYQKLAVLYNNIIAARAEEPELYANYVKPMGRFAMDQAQLGHVDDNLAVVYANMLEMGFLDRDIARSLSKILFTWKLVVFDERMVHVCVCHRQMKEMQIVPIVNHVAYFCVYTNDYVLLLEDAQGRRYASSIAYSTQQLMDPALYLDKCMALAPNELSYNLEALNRYYQQEQKNTRWLDNEDHVPDEDNDASHDKDGNEKSFHPEVCCNRLLTAQEISTEYKADIGSRILPMLYQWSDGTEFLHMFIHEVDFAYLASDYRKYLLKLLVEFGLYKNAYEYISEYGTDQLEPRAAKRLTEHMIEVCDGEEDEFLTGLAYRAFRENAWNLAWGDSEQASLNLSAANGVSGFNPTIMQYLCDHYSGPTDQMFDVWKKADDSGVHTYELEERILTQMLYADDLLPGTEPLFEKYYQNGGQELVVMAYLTQQSHDYFMEKTRGSKFLFDILESRYLYHMELNNSCKLALFKHLSECKEQTRSQRQATEELLAEFTRQNMYFAFYKNLDESLIQKFYLYDKVILEYRTKPGTHVVLHYCRDEDGEEYIDEEMMHVYDGIYVKLFVMFFGEMTRYYISEEDASHTRVTENSRLLGTCSEAGDNRRYDQLNQMLASASLMEKKELQDGMRRYQMLDEMTRTVFKCL